MYAIKAVLLAVCGNFFLLLFTAIAISCKQNGKRHYWVWYIVGAVQQAINVALIATSRLTGYPPTVNFAHNYEYLTDIPVLFAAVSAVLIAAGAVA